MKKNYVVILGIFILASFTLIILSSISFSDFIILPIQKIFSVPKSFVYSLKVNKKQPANGEIEKLQAENKRLSEKLVEYYSLKKDNEALRSQFETYGPQSQTLLPAKVIGAIGNFSLPHTLIIDKGKKNGVRTDMAVVSGKNLIGKIGMVGVGYSQVILMTNQNFKTLGKGADGDTRGVVIGKDDFILLDKVTTTQNLSKDDIILTKGETNNSGIGIQNDLIVGKIISINKIESQVFQSAKIESLVKFDELQTVFVQIGF
ncbi:MAG: hypothetical protein COX79_01345 [Candidatus Levybacteria bacterium CG_4_10_14_0_2_um_filter_36_16]|nr:MAG: hypothetical protein AUK12_02920 [Candidatus Levybacteria bacterium CG2_30_37_29]PIZ97677.1 MAG: hypothetical protein COX79_01345 [Candidatus Levybacteria bacterium CG_4_10_14_0_2_um_filter_36_16]PJA90800.1 MAG: hypothetical protein CO136_00495 [Candidatus Levybacteria bacterium CG_4_9_14_3_um_filter_36_7]